MSGSWRTPRRFALQAADNRAAQAVDRAFEPARVVRDLGLVKRWAQGGRMRHFAASAATDAAIVDGGDRLGAQRIGIFLQRQRWAAGQADAGAVAGADVFIDAESGAHDTLFLRESGCVFGAHAALPLELAFAVGDDYFQPLLGVASASRNVSSIAPPSK